MRTKLFNKGQVVIPAAIRRHLHLRIGDYLEIYEDGDSIRLVPVPGEGGLTEQLGGSLKDVRAQYGSPEKRDIVQTTEEGFINGSD